MYLLTFFEILANPLCAASYPLLEGVGNVVFVQLLAYHLPAASEGARGQPALCLTFGNYKKSARAAT